VLESFGPLSSKERENLWDSTEGRKEGGAPSQGANRPIESTIYGAEVSSCRQTEAGSPPRGAQWESCLFIHIVLAKSARRAGYRSEKEREEIKRKSSAAGYAKERGGVGGATSRRPLTCR